MVKNDEYSEKEQYNEETIYKVYPIRFYGLTLICLLNIVSSINWLCVAPVPDYANTFFSNIGLTTINWFSNCFLLIYIVAGPISSYVYYRHSIKTGLLVGCILQIIGAWLRYFSTFINTTGGRIGLAMLGQIFCGFGQPFILNASTPYASLWFSSKERSTASMAGGLANTVGMAIADLIVPSIVPDASSIQLNFLIIACITTGFGIPTVFIPHQPKTPPSFSASTHHERRQGLFKTLWALATNYNFLIIFFVFGVLCGLASTVTSMLPQIVEPYGVSYDNAGYLGVAFIVAGIIGAIGTGLFIDRTKLHKWVLRLYVPIVGFLYLALLMVVKKDNYNVIIAICAILGFFMFSLLPVALELSVESSYPISETISSSSLWMCSQILGLIFLIAFNDLRDDNADPPGNLRRGLILATCVAMPMMIFTSLYNSPNKRMDIEKEQEIIEG
ncbi:major facilitator superfamily domain-containing protein [Halteromyces radiatus]|uniref:major facilitator superfamily domain-containing protein n=1 Tax=Halteromyces radiatus TaxID=101107 RepID=UPI00221F5ED3|nr:major facilitator superfamily domain-containing protein [Halteromyces radiatus]KAI8090034.1 major facilitator superfamily domain-containing protein [Halteromyces radiatus]